MIATRSHQIEFTSSRFQTDRLRKKLHRCVIFVYILLCRREGPLCVRESVWMLLLSWLYFVYSQMSVLMFRRFSFFAVFNCLECLNYSRRAQFDFKQYWKMLGKSFQWMILCFSVFCDECSAKSSLTTLQGVTFDRTKNDFCFRERKMKMSKQFNGATIDRNSYRNVYYTLCGEFTLNRLYRFVE